MTTRTVHLDRGLPQLDPELRDAWTTWLTQHQLPAPMDIPLDSVIVCDDLARTVTAQRIVKVDGSIIRDPKTGLAKRETVTIQLEAPALPIPAGYRTEERA